jgi:hypothetical protein
MRNFLIVTILISLCVSCSENDSPDFDKFVYKFHDSSVPPEYHRSFTIIMSANEISKWVDSYGDTVSYDVKKVNESDFTKLKDIVAKAGLFKCPRNNNEGCTGGTGFSIYYFKDNKKIFKGSKWQCGGEFEGDLCGETDEILKYLNKVMGK